MYGKGHGDKWTHMNIEDCWSRPQTDVKRILFGTFRHTLLYDKTQFYFSPNVHRRGRVTPTPTSTVDNGWKTAQTGKLATVPAWVAYPERIRIQFINSLSSWIRIRIGIQNTDPDPGVKMPSNFEGKKVWENFVKSDLFSLLLFFLFSREENYLVRVQNSLKWSNTKEDLNILLMKMRRSEPQDPDLKLYGSGSV
jgi:hypothetical protein